MHNNIIVQWPAKSFHSSFDMEWRLLAGCHHLSNGRMLALIDVIPIDHPCRQEPAGVGVG